MMMLEIEGLSHSYARHRALRGVSIRVDASEVVAILGANGAGKTTLLNAIADLLRPSAGSIRFRGPEISGLSADRVVAEGIATVTKTRHLFGPMSVAENLSLGAFPPRAREAAPPTMDYVFDIFPRLAERRRQAVRTMSGGEQQMVAVGRALMAQPSLLLLDEPSLGLSPLFNALEPIAREPRMSILLVERGARSKWRAAPIFSPSAVSLAKETPHPWLTTRLWPRSTLVFKVERSRQSQSVSPETKTASPCSAKWGADDLCSPEDLAPTVVWITPTTKFWLAPRIF
jgi:branched-chain amino acid transport system ATP-binding protein